MSGDDGPDGAVPLGGAPAGHPFSGSSVGPSLPDAIVVQEPKGEHQVKQEPPAEKRGKAKPLTEQEVRDKRKTIKRQLDYFEHECDIFGGNGLASDEAIRPLKEQLRLLDELAEERGGTKKFLGFILAERKIFAPRKDESPAAYGQRLLTLIRDKAKQHLWKDEEAEKEES